jgi:pimeloyl-ACP methyl ester carboxylesterase
MARRIPGAELAVLEACGHLSNLEQPERFNEVMLEFLRRHQK